MFDSPPRPANLRLLSGVMLDALEVHDCGSRVEIADIEDLLNGLTDLAWTQVQAVGEGEEARAETPSGSQVSMLFMNGTLVHGSLIGVW